MGSGALSEGEPGPRGRTPPEEALRLPALPAETGPGESGTEDEHPSKIGMIGPTLEGEPELGPKSRPES